MFSRLAKLGIAVLLVSIRDSLLTDEAPNQTIAASKDLSPLPLSPSETQKIQASEGQEPAEDDLSGFKKHYAVNPSYSGSARSYQNIPNLLVVINGIATTYNALFSPVQQQNQGETDTMTSVINGLTMYATLRNFIIAFTLNFDQTQADLKYLIDNFGSIPFTKAEILTFYGLNDRYTAMKMNLNSTSITFRGLDTSLTAQTTVFTSTQSNINQGLKGIRAAGDEIYSETDYLRQNMNDNAALDTLQKIDATLLLLPTLIMKKYEIDADIKLVQTNFDGLTALRPQLVSTMDNMDLALKGLYSPPVDAVTSVRILDLGLAMLLVAFAL